jgi:hypothetical protein
MKRKTANIDIKVEPQLIEGIDAWRDRQRAPPSRTVTIGYVPEYFLKHDHVGTSGAFRGRGSYDLQRSPGPWVRHKSR